MTSRQTALRPLDEIDALPRMHASLVGSVPANDRTGDGSRSSIHANAATLGAPVILPLRKVR